MTFCHLKKLWLPLLVSILLCGLPLQAQTAEPSAQPTQSQTTESAEPTEPAEQAEPAEAAEPAEPAEPESSEPTEPAKEPDDIEELFAPDQPIKRSESKKPEQKEPETVKNSEPILYITDTDNGRIVVMQGLKGAGFTSLGLPGYGLGRFLRPAQIWVDYAGRVYVADSGNNRVIRINQDPSSNEPGWTEVGDLSEPKGVAVDGSNVYVADTKADRIVIFDEIVDKAKPREVLTHPQLKRPTELWIDAAGALYICGGDDPPGGKLFKTWVETGIAEKEGAEPKKTRRWAIYAGDGLSGSRFLPAAVVTAKSGVRLLDISGQRVISMADINGKRLREERFRLDPRWRLSRPAGMAVDKDGRTFIADSGNDRILEISSSGEVLDEYEIAEEDPGTMLANPSSIFIYSPAPPPPDKDDEPVGKGKGKGKSKAKSGSDLEFE